MSPTEDWPKEAKAADYERLSKRLKEIQSERNRLKRTLCDIAAMDCLAACTHKQLCASCIAALALEQQS